MIFRNLDCRNIISISKFTIQGRPYSYNYFEVCVFLSLLVIFEGFFLGFFHEEVVSLRVIFIGHLMRKVSD